MQKGGSLRAALVVFCVSYCLLRLVLVMTAAVVVAVVMIKIEEIE